MGSDLRRSGNGLIELARELNPLALYWGKWGSIQFQHPRRHPGQAAERR